MPTLIGDRATRSENRQPPVLPPPTPGDIQMASAGPMTPSAPRREDVVTPRDTQSVVSRQSSVSRLVAGIFDGFEDALSPQYPRMRSATESGAAQARPASSVSQPAPPTVAKEEGSPDFMSIASVSSGKSLERTDLLKKDLYKPDFPTRATTQSDREQSLGSGEVSMTNVPISFGFAVNPETPEADKLKKVF